MILICCGLNPDGSAEYCRSSDFRIDSYPTVQMMSEQVRNDVARGERINAHQERVQGELVGAANDNKP